MLRNKTRSAHTSKLTKKKSVKRDVTKKKRLSHKRVYNTSSRNMSNDAKYAPNHEGRYDEHLEKLNQEIENSPDGISAAYQRISRRAGSFPVREWTVRDSMAVLPHLLSSMAPNAALVQLATHRVGNLRAKLHNEEQASVQKKTEEFGDDKISLREWLVTRERYRKEFSIDLVPIEEIVSLQMQVLLSSAEHILLTYQDFCKSRFVWNNSFKIEQSKNTEHLLDSLLDHLESIPQLTFYRLHYQNALIHLMGSLIQPKYSVKDVIKVNQTLNADKMRRIFKARTFFAQSDEFKNTLKQGFKQAKVLADTTMLPLEDPINRTKLGVLHTLIAQAHATITEKMGFKPPVGHLFVETELAMGVRFPKQHKHILHVQNYYKMTKVAKMPHNPALARQYVEILDLLQPPEQRMVRIQSENPSEQYMSVTPTTTVNFIQQLDESVINLPEELWFVPLDREERKRKFEESPELAILWQTYNRLISVVDNNHKRMAVIDNYKQELEKLQKDQLSGSGLSSISEVDNRIEFLNFKIKNLDKELTESTDEIAQLKLEFKSKARLFRANNPNLEWDSFVEEIEPDSYAEELERKEAEKDKLPAHLDW